jgi:tryptophan synthase alpha chain
VLMGYLNPIEIRGNDRFADEAASAGVDGVLLVDLPPEEAVSLRTALSARDVALILLASPTTPEARMRRLQADAQGYLYYVSFAGVTGANRLDPAAAGERLRGMRATLQVPVLAGFGIRDAASAAAMAKDADGVVVGSALVEVLANAEDPAAAASAFLAPLRRALDAGPGVRAA